MKRNRLYKSLTPADEKELARLVNKYGRVLIAEQAEQVRPPQPAHRPPRGMPEVWAEAVQFVIGRYEARGSCSPVKDAAKLVYRIDYGGRYNDAKWPVFFESFKRRLVRSRSRCDWYSDA